MRQKLIEDNMNLVYYLLHTYYPKYGQDEDLIQCGMVGLCKAAEKWDESKSEFSTFASKCILNEFTNEFIRRKKHLGVLSLEYEYSDNEDDAVTLKDILQGDENVDYVEYDKFYESLPTLDKTIVDYKKTGLSCREIAKKLGYHHSYIARRLNVVRLQWRKFNGD